jgi:hypothetical protein
MQGVASFPVTLASAGNPVTSFFSFYFLMRITPHVYFDSCRLASHETTVQLCLIWSVYPLVIREL